MAEIEAVAVVMGVAVVVVCARLPEVRARTLQSSGQQLGVSQGF